MSSVLFDVLSGLTSAKNLAEQYILNKRLERYGTPSDFATLAGHPAVHDGEFRKRLLDMHGLVFKENPVPIACQAYFFDENVYIYRSGEERKTLVIGFCGHADLLFAPTAFQIQYICPEADLLVLNDPRKKGFLYGIPKVVDDFEGLIDVIRREFSIDDYKDIRTFGISIGGHAALAAGVIFGASASVAFGGSPPTRAYATLEADPEEDRRRGEAMAAILRRGARGRVSAVYGSDNERDRTGSEQLAELLPLKLIEVEETDQHNIVVHMHETGRLRRFYQYVGLLSAAR